MSEERWLPVEGFDGVYEISDCGRVRSRERLVTCHDGRSYMIPTKILRPQRRGLYLGVSLYKDARQNLVYIHRLVLEAFVGPCPVGWECRHHDNDRDNNAHTNLSWGTPKENAQDRIDCGSVRRGEACYFAKITEAQAREVKRLLAAGVKRSKIASLTGVHYRTVGNIQRGASWRWLDAA